MSYYPEFAGLVDEALARMDRSPSWLAQRLGVNPSTISRWLNHGGRPRDAETVVRVADILGLASHRDTLLVAAGFGYTEGTAARRTEAAEDREAAPHNLPAQRTPLFGRDHELAELGRVLSDPNVRLITLLGAGGMGKTRLAVEVALRRLASFVDGVYFVRLAPLDRSRDIEMAFAEALSLPFQPDARSYRRQLFDYLRNKQSLLILDNCEHLLDGIDLVHDLLADAPDVTVLATSRERLHLTGESVHSLAGIDCAGANGALSPAAQLFLYGAGHTSGAEHPSDTVQRSDSVPIPDRADVEQIGRICELVQGMPLAILLAATWTELLSPGEIAEQIERSLDFLDSDLRDLPERQRNMRAVFLHSWALLSDEEKRIFARLSVFQGGFFLQAGLSVAEASLRQLMTMMDKSLLTRTGDGHYEVHEVLRQFAAEELAASPDERAAVRDRHSAFFLKWLADLTPEFYGPQQTEVMEQVEAYRENVRLALEWAVNHGKWDRLADAPTGLGEYFAWNGRYQTGLDVFAYMDEKLSSDGSAEGRVLQVRLLTWRASFLRILGNREEATQHLDRAETLLLESSPSMEDTRIDRAALLRERAELVYVSDAEAAKVLALESARLSKEAGDEIGLAKMLFLMGANAFRRNELTDAQQHFAGSLTIWRDLGSPKGTAFSLSKLGYVIICQGGLQKAEPLIHESYDLFMEAGDQVSQARALRDLAGLRGFYGDHEEAARLLAQSRAMYSELGDRLGVTETTVNLLSNKIALGEYAGGAIGGHDRPGASVGSRLCVGDRVATRSPGPGGASGGSNSGGSFVAGGSGAGLCERRSAASSSAAGVSEPGCAWRWASMHRLASIWTMPCAPSSRRETFTVSWLRCPWRP